MAGAAQALGSDSSEDPGVADIRAQLRGARITDGRIAVDEMGLQDDGIVESEDGDILPSVDGEDNSES